MSLPRRPIGTTGIDVSCLGLGTVKLGRNQGVKYPASFELPSDQQVRELLARARALGINFIDTAPAYGRSEERLGALLADRQDWVLATKVGEEFTGGKSSFDFSAAHTRLSIERSLRRLRTDYLDLVLIHSDGRDLDILRDGACLLELQALKKEGLVRAIGMSTKTVAGGLEALEQTDLVMVTFNREQRQEEVVIDRAAQSHKGILVKKALNSGHLTSRSEAEEATVREEARDAAAASLQFVLNKPGVSSVIVGTLNPQHLQQNVEAAIQAADL